MERKEMMEGQKSSPTDELSAPKDYSAANVSAPRTWDEHRVTSASELFERLNQIPVNQVQPQARRELSSSEFLEFLEKQGPEGQHRHARSIIADGNSQGSSSKSQSLHNQDRDHDYQSVAIDQCDITSSVDYGSRDYYRPSTHTSDIPYARKEDELDELNKTYTDTRGNWWQGNMRELLRVDDC